MGVGVGVGESLTQTRRDDEPKHGDTLFVKDFRGPQKLE